MDSDGDGIPDNVDNCPLTPNPDQADTDGDGIGDACDNCKVHWNPGQEDSNLNGVGDVCEEWWCGGDSDGDACDNCPNVSNTDQHDSDGDGVGDVCDNCPFVSNPDHTDSNDDGIGDACQGVSYDCSISRVEHPIYGLGRECVARLTNVDLDSIPTGNMYTRRLDERLYELNDHLGNARAIISDRKLSDVSGGSPYHFRAEIASYNNLYPFGMEPPKRYVHSDLYRYGYTGMEKDSTASQDHYSTYFRPYDARLGRWWGIDPLTNPGESPYVAMGDDPIVLMDPSGADPSGTDTTKGVSQSPPLAPVHKGNTGLYHYENGDAVGAGKTLVFTSNGTYATDQFNRSMARTSGFQYASKIDHMTDDGRYSMSLVSTPNSTWSSIGSRHPAASNISLPSHDGDPVHTLATFEVSNDMWNFSEAGLKHAFSCQDNALTALAERMRAEDTPLGPILKPHWTETFIPVVGSTHSALFNIQQGRLFEGFLNFVMARTELAGIGEFVDLIKGGGALLKNALGLGEAIAPPLENAAERRTVVLVAPAVGNSARVALDANTLIHALEKGEMAAVDAAIAGRVPTVSITAAKEFLVKGDINLLREFLTSRGGIIGKAATSEQVGQLEERARLLARVLKSGDASVAGSAINEGAVVITRDRRFRRFLEAVKIPVQGF